jgi:hypothetical protein
MLELWGFVDRRRAWRGGSCVLGAVVLALGAGCSADPAEPTPVVLEYLGGVRFAAVSTDGTVYAADVLALYTIPAKPEPNITVSPTVPAAIRAVDDTPHVRGLARDLGGTVWMTAEQTGQSGQTVTTTVSGRDAGLVHQATGSVNRLASLREAAVPALPPHRVARPISSVAVPDAGSMLVATSQFGLSDNGDVADAIVWRVDAQGATAAAGRVTPTKIQRPGAGPRYLGLLRRPAQDLPAGESVPATSVDLQQVDAMLPLAPRRTLLVTRGQKPKDETDVGRAPERLFLFLLDGDRLSRIEAPNLADDVDLPLLSPLAGGRALLVSGWVEANGEVSSGRRTWSVVDPAARTVHRFGQDPGIAVGDGSRSYTAVSPTRVGEGDRNLVRHLPIPEE